MSNHFFRAVWISPMMVTATLLLASAGTAAEATKPISDLGSKPSPNLSALPAELTDSVAADDQVAAQMAQVTSVSQLSDVKPTDWAFQALQSLVERYGCIAGYPDTTYRGNRALTRYEFAAGLNACLDRVNELIAAATSDLVKKEDLATLQQLQTEFASELATLRGRVDALETKTATLEKQQFSTTTKLNAEVIIAVAGVATGEDAQGNRISRNPILGDRIRLNFDTSFTGEDLLRTRLQTLNLNAFSGTSTFTPEGDFRFAGGAFAADNNNSVGLDALLYQFPLGKKTTVILEANAGAIDDFTNTVNPFLDGDGGSGALTQFATRNPIYYLLNGTGIGIRHQFSDALELSLGYLANNAASPASGSGLFNGPYGAIAQVTVKPIPALTLGLTYINSYNTDFTGNGSSGSNRANLRSALANNPNLPTALNAFAGVDLPVVNNAFGVQASFRVTPQLVLNGWVGYTKTRTLSDLGGTLPKGDLDIWNWAVGIASPDLGKKGALAGIIVGMEPKVTGVTSALQAVIGRDSDTSLHVEAFYQYPINDRINITPGLVWITAPDHNNSNSDAVIGTIRTTFSF